jgi:hypothetical protein
MMISRLFLSFGVLFGLGGMMLGIYMAVTHDHTMAPVHAHINLVGWVTMFLAGLFYSVRPDRDGKLSKLHFGCSFFGFALMIPGLAGVMLGHSWGEPLAAAGSLLTLASMLLFAFIVLTTPPARYAG